MNSSPKCQTSLTEKREEVHRGKQMFLCWPSPWPPFSSKSSISKDEQIQPSAVLSPDVVSNKFDSSTLKKKKKK